MYFTELGPTNILICVQCARSRTFVTACWAWHWKPCRCPLECPGSLGSAFRPGLHLPPAAGRRAGGVMRCVADLVPSAGPMP